MQKRINVQVRKLVKSKNNKNHLMKQAQLINVQSRSSFSKKIIFSEKGVTFQQLYFKMKKQKQNCSINSNGSSTTIVYKNTKNTDNSLITPQNRSRIIMMDQSSSQKVHKSFKSLNKVSHQNDKNKKQNEEHNQGRKTMKRVIKKKQPYQNQQPLITKQNNPTLKQCKRQIRHEAQIHLSTLTPTTNYSKFRINASSSLKTQFEQVFCDLDHTMHTHLREVECFLQFNEFIHVLSVLKFTQFSDMQKYDNSKVNYSPLKPDFYVDCLYYTYILKMWKQLGGQTYGGIVKDNLLSFLTIIAGQSKDQYQKFNNCPKPIKNCYINTNLKLSVNIDQIEQIFVCYLPLKMKRQSQLKNSSTIQFKTDFNLIQKYGQTLKIQKNEMVLKNITNQINQKQHNIQKNQSLSGQKQNKQDLQITESIKKKMSQFSPKLIPQCKSSQLHLEESLQFLTPQISKQLQSQQIPSMIQTQSRQQIIQSKRPLLSVDVNMGQGKSQKLIVYQGENAYEVSLRLKQKYKISEQLREKFLFMLDQHMRNLLFKIQQVSEQLFSDHQLQSEQRNKINVSMVNGQNPKTQSIQLK